MNDFGEAIAAFVAISDGLSFLWAWGFMIIRGLFFIPFVVLKTEHN